MCRLVVLTIATSALLAACGEPAEQAESADDFAARINGQQPIAIADGALDEPTTPVSGTASAPAPDPAPGLAVPGAQTDPATCGASQVVSYVGREATESVRAELARAATDADQIRFRAPGPFVTADDRADRLNVMLDNRNIIRDLRCQ